MADVEEMITCVNCHHEVPRNSMRCPHCLRNPRKLVAAPVTAAPAQATGLVGGMATFTLPNFRSASVPPGEVAIFGRESDDPAITEALYLYPDVSRAHVEVHNRADGLGALDNGSTEGTWLDDERLPFGELVPLRPGQVLRLGTYCYVKVESYE